MRVEYYFEFSIRERVNKHSPDQAAPRSHLSPPPAPAPGLADSVLICPIPENHKKIQIKFNTRIDKGLFESQPNSIADHSLESSCIHVHHV